MRRARASTTWRRQSPWLGVGVGLATLPLLGVRWGHVVEWKESRMGGARCEVGDAGMAGRRELKSPPTRGEVR
jgi:hypothetical protein